MTGPPQMLEAFESERIHLLERDDKILVMDRQTGRWVMLPSDHMDRLRLLGAGDLQQLPESTRQHVLALREMLAKRQMGVGRGRSFKSLNTIILKLTKACNLACAYCYDFEQEDIARRIEPRQALEAVRQAIEVCDGRLQVLLHGGEPMLVWDLVEEIVFEGERLGKIHGVKVSFIGQTNLTILNDRIVSFSEEHGITWGVSLDGPPERHDAFRVTHNGRGSYRLIERSLERYPKFARQCSVLSTITRANHDNLLEAARFVRDLGMAAWDWTLFQPIGRGRESSRFEYDIQVLVDSWEQLFMAVERGEFDGFAVQPVLKYIDNFYTGPGANMCMRPECGAARDLMSVSYDGTIEACDCIDPQGPLAGLGNIETTGLVAARSGEVVERIRSRNVQQQRCGSCIWFGVCGGTCLAHAGGVDQIWDESCALSLVAFDLISNSLANSERLLKYRDSCSLNTNG